MLLILDTIEFAATHLTTTADFMQLRHNIKYITKRNVNKRYAY